MTTPTPRAVLDAGQRERERWKIRRQDVGPCLVYPVEYVGFPEASHAGSLAKCQDFIADRVFRAMLREWFATEAGDAAGAETCLALLALAGDDHGQT